jgi:hypothetical protein
MIERVRFAGYVRALVKHPAQMATGKRSYVLQYRALGRSRRYTIGLHGVWTAESARQEAKIQLGRVAQGDNPAEERQLDHKAITVKELCTLYLNDLNAGLILRKGGRPKKPHTIVTDVGRINRHIIPLLGTRRVKDLTKTDINKALKDIMAGKTAVSVKTNKLRGKAIVRGGVGTATRTVGLLGGILTYAVEAGIIAVNPAQWSAEAERQCAHPPLDGGGISDAGRDAARGRRRCEICDDRRNHSSDCAHWQPQERDDRSHVDRGRHRWKLLEADR